MTNFDLEQNVTSLSDSKRLTEAGIDFEADGYWFYWGEALYFNELYAGNATRDVQLISGKNLSKVRSLESTK